MNKSLKYTLVGEGFAEYQFIPAYMNWVARQIDGLQISRTNIQIAITKNPSMSKVLQTAATLCVRSFANTKDPCNLFIAGIDLDEADFTDNLELHGKRITELSGKMGKVYGQYKDKIALYVPIQAIDYWIYYVQSNGVANSLESTGKDEIKKKVYGLKNPDRQRIEKVVRDVAVNADFTKLAKQSRSFNHFHKQITAFLTQYSK